MGKNVYDIVADKIIEKLEAGTIPWHRPWQCDGSGIPKNAVSKKMYRGINVPMLAVEGYGCPYWASFKQIGNGLNGRVNKGEKSTLVVFWKVLEKLVADMTTEEKAKLTDGERSRGKKLTYMLRYYLVWNLEQTTVTKEFDEGKIEEGKWTPNEDGKEFNSIEKAEQVIAGYKDAPEFKFGGDRAFYNPKKDTIGLPAKTSFDKEEGYYATAFHEMSHSTGHEKRLNRPDFAGNFFGDEDYSKEELIAEAGASYLCAVAGIDNTIENSVAYIQNWLQALNENRKWVVCAFAKAQHATDYILDKEVNKESETN